MDADTQEYQHHIEYSWGRVASSNHAYHAVVHQAYRLTGLDRRARVVLGEG